MHKSSSDYAIKLTALHGFTGNGSDFSLLKEQLSPLVGSTHQRTVEWCLPTLPGHEPDVPDNTPSTIQEYCNWVDRLSDSAHVKNHALNILIGYSMGARLALLHASAKTKSWDGIILISGNPGIIDDNARRSRIEEDAALIDIIKERGLEHFLRSWKENPILRHQQNAPKEFLEAMQCRKSLLRDEGIIRALLDFGQGVFPNLWDEITSIQSPILLISGQKDPKYTAMSLAIKNLSDNATHAIIETSGHSPHIEAPLEVAQHIETFIKTLWSATSDF